MDLKTNFIMKNLTKILGLIYVAIIMIAVACKKDEPTPTPPVTTPTTTPPVVTKSTAKDITKFSFAALSPAVDATIDATAKTITATVPAATDLTKLVPTITLSDKATVSPASSVATDFSKEVSYTVTAEDLSVVVWKVNVKKEVMATNNSTCYYKTIKGSDANQTSYNYEYNAKNRLVKLIVSIFGTTTNATQTYKYDADDYVTDYSYVSYDYTTNQTYSYQNGKRISEKGTYKVSGNSTTYDFLITYEYDSNGNLIKMNDNGVVYVYNNGKTISITDPTTNYQLNVQGLVMKSTIIADGSYYVYTYNADGLQKLKEKFDKNGKRNESRVREYIKEKGGLEDNGTSKGVSTLPDAYGEGYLEKETKYTVNASNIETKVQESLYTYNNKGHKDTLTYMDGTGKVLIVYTYSYQGCN